MSNDDERLFFIKRSSLNLIKRMFLRSIVLMLLTAIGFWVADTLVESSRYGDLPILRRFPDFIALMTAAAKFTFIEMSLFWIRFSTQPKNDVQESIAVANREPMSAAFLHLTNSLVWAFRVGVFLWLLYN